jgi:hypothetical protein
MSLVMYEAAYSVESKHRASIRMKQARRGLFATNFTLGLMFGLLFKYEGMFNRNIFHPITRRIIQGNTTLHHCKIFMILLFICLDFPRPFSRISFNVTECQVSAARINRM